MAESSVPTVPLTQAARSLTLRMLLGLAMAISAAGALNLGLLPAAAQAKEAQALAENPALEARMLAITAELRCLVCQNQSVADSHSGLAADLRREVREMLAQGKSDQEVRDFMTQRYGDFILYRPPVRSSTALLWYGPAALAVIGLLVLVGILRRRSRMAPEAFDPDLPDEGDASSPR
jgi:cytochrome c-type biogenesis protein CcmH